MKKQIAIGSIIGALAGGGSGAVGTHTYYQQQIQQDGYKVVDGTRIYHLDVVGQLSICKNPDKFDECEIAKRTCEISPERCEYK